MKVPDWRNLVLNEGLIPEPIPDDSRIALWLPGSREGGFQHWKRVSNVARAEVTVRQGICATPAMLIQARQPVGGILGKLFGRRSVPEDRAWLLPNGKSAEQWGERQTDLILVWAEDDSTPLHESGIKSQWPESKEFHKLGKNLFLVSGIEPPPPPKIEREQAPPQGCPRPVAEQLLADARQRGDRRKEAAALLDLGIIHRQEGDPKRALVLLEEALPITRELGDRSGEREVLGQLGLANLAVGQARRALELLEQELAYARETDEPFGEKAALDHLGLAYSSLRDHVRAVTFFEPALALARQVGDRKHEAELLWYLAIQHAELGSRDQAIDHAQATVDLLKSAGKPPAAWFAHHLERYRKGETAVGLAETSESGPGAATDAYLGGSIIAGFWSSPAGPQVAQATSSPSLLRMAFSAGKSMAKFLGSGFRVVTPATHQARLRTCAACEHHTGVRCRLCGCFTNVKARLAHEECPIGKWPA